MALAPGLREGLFAPLHKQDPDNPTLAKLEGAHSEMRRTMLQIEDGFKASMANENQTIAANLKASSVSAYKRQTKALKAADRALAEAGVELKAIDAEISAPIAKPKDAAIAREIREHVKGMSNDDRRAFFNTAVAAKDVDTLSAIMNAPSYLSGMSDVEQGGYAERLKLALFPDQLRRREAITKGVSHLENGAALIMDRVTKLHDPKELDRLDDLDEAAKKALND